MHGKCSSVARASNIGLLSHPPPPLLLVGTCHPPLLRCLLPPRACAQHTQVLQLSTRQSRSLHATRHHFFPTRANVRVLLPPATATSLSPLPPHRYTEPKLPPTSEMGVCKNLAQETTLKLRARLESRKHTQLTRTQWNRSHFGAVNLTVFSGCIPLFI
jgi:hypothetical protein